MPFLLGNIRDYGATYSFHTGGMHKSILTTEPEVVRHILQKNHRNYRKSKLQTVILGHYMGKGLLTVDGDFWLRQRRLIQPAFHRDRLEELIAVMHTEIQTFFAQRWKSGDVRNVYEDMHELTFRIIARSLFSTAMEDSEIHRLSEQITSLQAFIVRRIRKPFLQWWFSISGAMKYYDKEALKVKNTLLGIIRRRTSQRETGEYGDLLDMLLATRYQDTGEPMTEEQLLDEVLILFVAGHETSANALSWALYLLGQFPGHIEAIRREGPLEDVSLKGVISKTYTQQVIEETMRLYPPAWMIDRVSIEDDGIGDLSWAADTFFLLYIYGMHHNPELWPNPDAFQPERFSTDNKETHVPYSYLPFGAGPRLCIGNQFAMAEMILTLTEIVNTYNIELQNKIADISLRPLVTLRPDRPILLKVNKRS